MKLSKKDKKLITELIHCEQYALEQSVGVLFDEKRRKRLMKLKRKLQ
jgi:hypothetical protein